MRANGSCRLATAPHQTLASTTADPSWLITKFEGSSFWTNSFSTWLYSLHSMFEREDEGFGEGFKEWFLSGAYTYIK